MSQKSPLPTRVLLVDDHPIVRQGISALLQHENDITVIGEANNGLEAVAFTKEHQPDLVILDLGLPGISGTETIPLLQNAHPTVQILILSMHAEDEYVLPTIQAGIQGYLLKGSDLSELVKAIHSITQGIPFWGPSIQNRLPRSSLSSKGKSPLTPRELEVLRWITEGYTAPQIANQLSISARTVETHRKNIMEKLGIFGVAGLVKYAIRHGLTTLDP